MKPENQELKIILKHLHEQRGLDFSGFRAPMLERRLQKRIFASKSIDLNNYFDYLKNHPDEFDKLIDVFTINVSRFFRNSMAFEYIRRMIIPELFSIKLKTNDKSIRLWSAGCSFGEEAYSLAIILNEFISKGSSPTQASIFATDIDKKAIKRAIKGIYNLESIKNVKYGILEKYFTKKEAHFMIDDELKKKVHFSFYDMLDKNSSAPPDSIYGDFDIIMCRNVLIYFNLEYQEIIFNKLYKSLKPNGYLVLGEAEIPVDGFKHKFKRETKCCKIYRKIG